MDVLDVFKLNSEFFNIDFVKSKHWVHMLIKTITISLLEGSSNIKVRPYDQVL